MKKLVLIITFVMFSIVGFANAGDNYIYTEQLNTDSVTWVGQTIAASGSLTSDAIDLNNYRLDGYFAIQFKFTGSGTIALTYTMSNNNSSFAAPISDDGSSGTIVTGLTTGTYLYQFKPETFRYIKIVATETGTSDDVDIVEALLSIQ
ncbi:MAG: hypothetical protein SVO01_00120 [Thermotogota bacterium]|nr:hypothetical protein [Thermotogota bacterium]